MIDGILVFNNFRSGDIIKLLNFTLRDDYNNIYIPLDENQLSKFYVIVNINP